MPYLDFNKEKSFGDLIVKVNVIFPDTMDINIIPLLRGILEFDKDLPPQDDAEGCEVYPLIPFTSDHYSPDYNYNDNSDYYSDDYDDSYWLFNINH